MHVKMTCQIGVEMKEKVERQRISRLVNLALIDNLLKFKLNRKGLNHL